MWNDVVVEVLFRNLRVACGLRIEFKHVCLQAGELATELWRLVPIYVYIHRLKEKSPYSCT